MNVPLAAISLPSGDNQVPAHCATDCVIGQADFFARNNSPPHVSPTSTFQTPVVFLIDRQRFSIKRAR
jgi:hypothetical protein